MDDRIARTLLALCRERGSARSICPSEVARALSRDEAQWRALMPLVRATAAALAARGDIVVTQRGRAIDIDTARGPVRVKLQPQN